jgi:hypothetical protein
MSSFIGYLASNRRSAPDRPQLTPGTHRPAAQARLTGRRACREGFNIRSIMHMNIERM